MVLAKFLPRQVPVIAGTVCLLRSPSGLTSNIPSTHQTERTEQRVHMCHTHSVFSQALYFFKMKVAVAYTDILCT